MSVQEGLAAAIKLHQSGALRQAEAAYREILHDDPRHPDALHLLGVLAHQTGKHDAAVTLIEKAVALRPAVAAYHTNLGAAHHDLGDYDAAIACYGESLRLQPGNSAAHCNLARALLSSGQPEAARKACQQALDHDATSSDAHFIMGNILRRMIDLDGAAAAFGEALRLKPDFAAARVNLGATLKLAGDQSGAEEALRSALKIAPGMPEAHHNLGTVLEETGRMSEALDHFRQALESRPGYGEAQSGMAKTLLRMGRAEEADEAYRRATDLAPENALIRSGYVYCAHYMAQDAEVPLERARDWSTRHGTAAPARPGGDKSGDDPDRPLRIGYVSPDFRHHSVGYFMAAVLSGHRERGSEAICYSNHWLQDGLTRQFKAMSGGWRDIYALSDEAAAALIRQDEIDILVDLSGHTDRHRLQLFARRPAPVQATYLGFPGTTGLAAMDYRLTDALADPAPDCDDHYAEELVRMAGCFLCYLPPGDAPAVSPAPVGEAGYVTFGSFNNLAKTASDVVACWSRILLAVPGSRLLLKQGAFECATVKSWYEELFSGHGVDRSRLTFAGFANSTVDHLGMYGQVDIALDPFPYNGTTTTCEALWMGVPVVALEGNRHAGRVGVSLLNAADMGHLVAPDLDSYVDLAAGLAANKDRLSELRAGQRSALEGTTLLDRSGFIGALEQAYRDMWRARCRH